MPAKGTGRGLKVNHDGYLRICRRGPLYDVMAHRAYANRQWRERYGEDMPSYFEVHHNCRNRACWPPTDFHLVIMDARLHAAIEVQNSKQRRLSRKVSR